MVVVFFFLCVHGFLHFLHVFVSALCLRFATRTPIHRANGVRAGIPRTPLSGIRDAPFHAVHPVTRTGYVLWHASSTKRATPSVEFLDSEARLFCFANWGRDFQFIPRFTFLQRADRVTILAPCRCILGCCRLLRSEQTGRNLRHVPTTASCAGSPAVRVPCVLCQCSRMPCKLPVSVFALPAVKRSSFVVHSKHHLSRKCLPLLLHPVAMSTAKACPKAVDR